MNKFLLGALSIAATLGTYATPALARVDAQVSINIGPPAARIEAFPQARRGQQWVPGYWDWRRGRHVWVPGTWLRVQPGYRYSQPQWVSHNGRWILVRGHWARDGRDRDRDGVPNRYDHDRDGDGVPNRRDSRPDNPYRR